MRIVIVEDDVFLRECLVQAIHAKGFEVAEYGSAEAALSQFALGGYPDILITDIDLGGGVNGYGLGAMVRRQQPECGLIYISGDLSAARDNTATPPRPEARERFLAKPFRMAALMTIIRQWADKPAGQPVLTPAPVPTPLLDIVAMGAQASGVAGD